MGLRAVGTLRVQAAAFGGERYTDFWRPLDGDLAGAGQAGRCSPINNRDFLAFSIKYSF